MPKKRGVKSHAWVPLNRNASKKLFSAKRAQQLCCGREKAVVAASDIFLRIVWGRAFFSR